MGIESQVDKVITELAQISNIGMATIAVDCFFSFIRENLQVFPCFAKPGDLSKKKTRSWSSTVNTESKARTVILPNEEVLKRRLDETNFCGPNSNYILRYDDGKKRILDES